jgi:hypothetical protein
MKTYHKFIYKYSCYLAPIIERDVQSTYNVTLANMKDLNFDDERRLIRQLFFFQNESIIKTCLKHNNCMVNRAVEYLTCGLSSI